MGTKRLVVLLQVCLVVAAVAGCSAKTKWTYGCYRFDDNFDKGVLVDGVVSQPAGGSMRRIDLTGWTSESGASKVEETGSTIAFAAEGKDRLVSPKGLAIPGGSTDTIILKMKASGTDEVFLDWIPKGSNLEEHRILRIRVPKQDEPTVYHLQMTKVRAWRHKEIDQLLFELRSGGRLEVQSIELVDRRAAFEKAAAGVAQFSIDNLLRPCVFSHCPGKVKYRVRVPERAVFTAGLGIVEPDMATTFQLVVESEGKVTTVLSKEVTDASVWEKAEADLSAYGGRDVDLTLVSESSGSGQVALWSNPGVFERYAAETKPGDRLPNVILYVIDCLRPDHLEAYGYGRETAPNLKSFAASGVKFERCFATDTWTKSSTTSFLAGVDQFSHGVEQFGDVLPEDLATFPELLRRAGYETCVLTENPHTPPETVPRAAYSFLEPIHLNVELPETPLKWDELPPVTRATASSFLRRHLDRPFFLYIHSMELHDVREPGSSEFAYESPEVFRNIFTSPQGQTRMDTYDCAIAHADSNFKKFMTRIEELGLAENTVVIVTADHGEDFGEHEDHYAHNGKPYNTLTRVPLLIRWPGHLPAGRVVGENVSLLDLAPTILEMTGQPPFDQFQGLSLLPLINGRNRSAFNERLIVSKWYGAIGAVEGNWKLFTNTTVTDLRLFDLAKDFGETTDVAAQNGGVLEKLKAEYQAYVARQQARREALGKHPKPGVKLDPVTEQQRQDLGYGSEGEAVKVDPVAEEQLKNLGYLND